MGELEELHDRHGDDVAFFIVYIREAHPEDGWVLADNRRQEIAIVDPTSLEERAEAAEACAVRLQTRIPILLDDVDDEVALAYGGGGPVYLIGRDGRVASRERARAGRLQAEEWARDRDQSPDRAESTVSAEGSGPADPVTCGRLSNVYVQPSRNS